MQGIIVTATLQQGHTTEEEEEEMCVCVCVV